MIIKANSLIEDSCKGKWQNLKLIEILANSERLASKAVRQIIDQNWTSIFSFLVFLKILISRQFFGVQHCFPLLVLQVLSASESKCDCYFSNLTAMKCILSAEIKKEKDKFKIFSFFAFKLRVEPDGGDPEWALADDVNPNVAADKGEQPRERIHQSSVKSRQTNSGYSHLSINNLCNFVPLQFHKSSTSTSHLSMCVW